MATPPATKKVDQLLSGRRRRYRLVPPGHYFQAEVLEETSFIRMLRLERKRTERSCKPFLLLVIDVEELLQRVDAQEVIGNLVVAISDSSREVDTLGWYQQRARLGMLFVEIGSAESSAIKKIVEKVTLALQHALTTEEFNLVNVTFRIFPQDSDHIDEAGGDATLYPEFSDRHFPKQGARLFKRVIDVAGSLLALMALSPALVVIAVLIKLTSKGPILFRQQRLGQYGAPFTFLKFRSMHTNNDPKIHQEYVARLISGKGDLKQADGKGNGAYKLTNDSRITPLGKFLRRTSFDELPQFLNVLKGEMSLVGPRPPLRYEFDSYHIWHKPRVLEVKPGITGLWQVNGRSKITFDDMVRLDLRYARNWSIWLDLKILLQTPKAVFSGAGAY
jgi:lipopolysaccharide/colanic/teichoic acid biosynthesis glycosyltransferase